MGSLNANPKIQANLVIHALPSDNCLHCVVVVPKNTEVMPDPKLSFFQTHIDDIEHYDEDTAHRFVESSKIRQHPVMFGYMQPS